jgi:hypothetical protein
MVKSENLVFLFTEITFFDCYLEHSLFWWVLNHSLEFGVFSVGGPKLIAE